MSIVKTQKNSGHRTCSEDHMRSIIHHVFRIWRHFYYILIYSKNCNYIRIVIEVQEQNDILANSENSEMVFGAETIFFIYSRTCYSYEVWVKKAKYYEL